MSSGWAGQKALQYLAGISDGLQDAPCPDMQEFEPISGFNWGDLNCDGQVNGLDALFILLFKAGLALPDPISGCFHVGEAIG